MTVCALGHTAKAYECPACAEASGQTVSQEHWRWYRGRTSSKRIKELIDVHLAALTSPVDTAPRRLRKHGPQGWWYE